MGIFSRFENRMEDAFDNAAEKMFDAPISPVQIAKKAEKQMKREKMVGAGKQYAPTLYTVLVSPEDDERFFGYYPTLAGETETYLSAKAADAGLITDGQPLVRFIADDSLRRGKFDVIAEIVAAPIVEQLRQEEFERYGIPVPQQNGYNQNNYAPQQNNQAFSQGQGFAQGQAMQGAPMSGQGFAQGAPMQGQAMQGQPLQGQPDVAKTTVMPAAAAFVSQAPNSANPIPQAQLVDQATGQIFPLTHAGQRLSLGRETTNNIVVNDINASRIHAEVRYEPQGVWTITDLKSTNGTFVNARKITTSPLNEGDNITIGLTNYAFHLI